ncbi:uncharacterized protein METZ01_LOCUS115536 [marine metagenome]|uniref:Pyridoxamine 5'-phosphate oxidase putative domain-containing protein n=1 Tax=marine metagenome TaxID=408172 RepID=A0A381XDT3_9ZZZZ
MAALPEPLPQNPLPLLDQWLADALVSSPLPNSNAFALATVGANNKPSVRMVLCKDLSITSGYLVFYTNYESPKAEDIVHMPRVAAVFNWSEQQRQARLEGIAIKSPENESERYFATRDVESQIGAWASRQSQPLVSREALLTKFNYATERYNADSVESIPRPDYWGGYRLWIDAVELWVSGEARLHDRARWDRQLSADEKLAFSASPWRVTRLQP